MTRHNKSTNKLKPSDIREILIDDTKTMYKNNNINCLQILEAMRIIFLKIL